GVITAAGRGASPSQLTDAFGALNRMIDAWSLQRLMVYTIQPTRYSLAVSKPSYTIGPGGDFNTPSRPVRIDDANYVFPSGLLGQIKLLSQAQWADKALPVIASTVPTELYYDNAYPLGKIYLWGYPTAGGQLELYTWQVLTQFAAQTDTVVLAPGYAEA